MEVDDLIWQPLKVSAERIRTSLCSNISKSNSKTLDGQATARRTQLLEKK